MNSTPEQQPEQPPRYQPPQPDQAQPHYQPPQQMPVPHPETAVPVHAQLPQQQYQAQPQYAAPQQQYAAQPTPRSAPTKAPRVLGITATIVAGLGVVSALIVLLLAATVDENWAWFLILLIPFMILVGFVAVILAVIGLVVAARSGAGRGWPVTGIVVGAVSIAPLFWWISLY